MVIISRRPTWHGNDARAKSVLKTSEIYFNRGICITHVPTVDNLRAQIIIGYFNFGVCKTQFPGLNLFGDCCESVLVYATIFGGQYAWWKRIGANIYTQPSCDGYFG